MSTFSPRHGKRTASFLVFDSAALLLLSGAGYLTVLELAQLHAVVLLLIDAHSHGTLVWQTFFSLHCLVLGYLIFEAGYFPRILGVLMVFASSGYLADSLGSFLSASYQERFAWIVYVTSFVGEFPFFVWLLFKGVNVQRWE